MPDNDNFSNFNFLKSVNQNLYTSIKEAESLARVKFIDCGQKSRQACEIFIDSILRKKGLSDKIVGDLFTKISSLQDETFLKSIGYLSSNQSLSNKPIIPDIGTIDFVANSGKINYNCDYYDFLRRFGNTCSHPQNKPHEPRIDFTNVVKCLQGFRLLFAKYYSQQIPKGIGPFKVDLMPIDKFYITTSFIPSDQVRSKCKREFWGYSLDDRQNISYYCILRQYDKDDVDNNFMLRNYDVFLEASKETISGIPEGMTSFRTIVGTDNSSSSFYITAHLFRYEPKPLSFDLLNGTTIKQRLELCFGICSCFANLHNADIPIYHRLLNYDSVVVCKFKDRLIPYVIKFDYGKLNVSDQYQTIFQEAKQAERNIQKEKSLTKYLAPEWNTITNSASADWEKIDIYSLGVLFSDILVGRFDGDLVSFDELEELELSDDLLDTLDMMTSESITNRSNLEYVQLVFQEEIKAWS